MPEQGDTSEQQSVRAAAALAARDRAAAMSRPHWIWRVAGVAGSAALAVSVYLPWIPLRGLERVNLIELVVSLSRVGVPRVLWLVPLVVGAAGLIAACVPKPVIRGTGTVALALALGTVTLLVRTDLTRAADAASLVPLSVRSLGSGPYVYVLGIIVLLGAGLGTCWHSRTARVYTFVLLAVGLAVATLVPRVREPMPQIVVQAADARVDGEPVRTVHVAVRNRANHPISLVDTLPTVLDSSVYVVTMSKRDETVGTFVDLPLYEVTEPETLLPREVPGKSTAELEFEFRPAWEPIPAGSRAPPFAASAAGRYRIRMSNVALGRSVETEFTVEPVAHPETDALRLLDQVRRLVAASEFAGAGAAAERLAESYPGTWAARRLRQLRPRIDAAASLDTELAVAEDALAQSARRESGGDVAEAARLVETACERLDSLKEAVADNDRLRAMIERLERRRTTLQSALRERDAGRIYGAMQAAADDGDYTRAAALASQLREDYSTTRTYADALPDVGRMLRLAALAGRFKLVSIVRVGNQVHALLRDAETDAQLTVSSGEIINGDIRVVRIDDSARSVLIRQGNLTHELTMR